MQKFIAFLLIMAFAPGVHAQPEATRVRILLVLDTHDEDGATWALDGENVKRFLETSLKKQDLEFRHTLDVLTGSQVTAANILDHYRKRPVARDETLLFYYSGHGAWHRQRGHFLALHHGPLFRSDLLKAMRALEPRAAIVLTDCCANIAAGAFSAEPPRAESRDLVIRNANPPKPAAKKEEPTLVLQRDATGLIEKFLTPMRMHAYKKTAGKARLQEPPAKMEAFKNDDPRNSMKAKLEAPPGAVESSIRMNLELVNGPVNIDDILAKCDGQAVRHLLFHSRGLVDINSSQKDRFSHGEFQWGGSLFTNAWLGLNQLPWQKLDRDGNGTIEWHEIFPLLRDDTNAIAGRLSKGKLTQTPEYDFSRR